MGSALDSHWARATQKPDRLQNASVPKSSAVFSGNRARPGTRNFHGAVHDKPDDKLNIIKYDLEARNSDDQQIHILVFVGRVWSRSEGGKAGGAINRSHSNKKNKRVEETGKNLKIPKQGAGPALFFVAARQWEEA
jgi:hypothetical protein